MIEFIYILGYIIGIITWYSDKITEIFLAVILLYLAYQFSMMTHERLK